jgi:hypothetical protein
MQYKNHHILPPAAFTKLITLDEVVVRLFGDLPVPRAIGAEAFAQLESFSQVRDADPSVARHRQRRLTFG